MRPIGIRICLLVLILLGVVSSSRGQSVPPSEGYVPDEATAVRIAVAVFIPIFGEKHVRSERPFHARLKDGIWIVEGSLGKPPKPGDIVVGGTMVSEIERATGCIKAVYHLK